MSHWYDKKTGLPAYTQKDKKGGERPTTLRDARVKGYVPSVTTVTAEGAKPGLENWKIDNAIMAALTLPRLENESDKDFLDRVKVDSKERAKKAAELGTQIHNYLEQGYKDFSSITEEMFPYCNNVMNEIHRHCGDVEWIAEDSFAFNGYGGKCDLHSKGPDHIVIDFKTKEVKGGHTEMMELTTWPEHDMQLSAYRAGLGIPEARCAIVYVNTITAEARLIWLNEKDLQKGYKMFLALLDYFYAKTGLERG